MYSFQILKNGTTVEEKHRCKGIQRAAQNSLTHADFLAQLQRPSENFLVNRRFGSKLHQIYTYETKKRGLCAYDDKRFLLEDGVQSLAFGHRDITARVQDDMAPDGTELVVSGNDHAVANEAELVEALGGMDPLEAAGYHPLTCLPTDDTTAPQPAPDSQPGVQRPSYLPSNEDLAAFANRPAAQPRTPRYLPANPEQIVSTTHSRYLPPTPDNIQLCSRQLPNSSRYLPPN